MIRCGFVVNVFDPLNFDIDIPDDFPGAIRNNYQYFDNIITSAPSVPSSSKSIIYEPSFYNLPDVDVIEIKYGRAYRCRLFGIRNPNKGKHNRDAAQKDINRMIDDNNGWIRVETHGTDIYHRLLISIFDLKTKENMINKLIDHYGYERYVRSEHKDEED